MSVLRAIESKIEGLFEGIFGRAFRTHVQPVELARKLAKEMDEHRSVSVSRVYVPNEYTLYLSPADRAQFAAYEGSLVGELQEYLGEHARREGYALLTAPRVLLQTDADLAMGEFGIATRVVQREEPEPAAPVGAPVGAAAPLPTPVAEAEPELPPAPPVPAAPAATMIYRPETPLAELEEDAAPPPVQRETVTLTVDGRVVPITSSRVVVGRSRECDVRIDDGNVSRRHCEVAQESPTAWVVADLGSTNGTEVNGRKVSRRTRLDDGDRITVGGTELVFGRTVQ
jgi:pSer/pThr/pTyr-binding forkhead associated (FHA) protein